MSKANPRVYLCEAEAEGFRENLGSVQQASPLFGFSNSSVSQGSCRCAQVYLCVTTILVKTKLYIAQLVECVPGIREALDRISFVINPANKANNNKSLPRHDVPSL